MKKIILGTLILILCLSVLAIGEDTFDPLTYILLDVGTLSVASDTVQTADSVRWVWGRRVGVTKIQYGTKKATSDSANWITGVGHYSYEIQAGFGFDSTWRCYATAKVYRFNKQDIKVWNWVTKENLDRSWEDVRGVLVGDDQTKVIYMAPWGIGANDGLTPKTPVCSLLTAEALCSGAQNYLIVASPGIYPKCKTTVNVAGNVEIRGAGMNYTIFTGDSTEGSDECIYVNMASSYSFKCSGFTIKFNFMGNSTNDDAIRIGNCSNFEIRDVKTKNARHGIYVDAGTGHIYKNYILHSYADGIILDNGDYCLIHDNNIDSLGYADLADAIALWPSASDNMVFHNYIRTTTGSAIRTYSGGVRNSIFDNYIYNDQDTAMIFVGANGTATVGNRRPSMIASTNRTLEADLYTLDTALNEIKAKTDKFSFVANGAGYNVNANMNMVDSNFTSAYNLKLITDGDTATATNAPITASKFVITATGNDDAVFWRGSGSGWSANWLGGSTGGGIKGFAGSSAIQPGFHFKAGGAAAGHDGGIIEGTGTSGHGLLLSASYGHGFYATSSHGDAVRLDSPEGVDLNLVGSGTIEGTMPDLQTIKYFLGASSGDTIVFYPPNGTANKDSFVVYNNGWKRSGKFAHNNNPVVIDTLFTK